MTFHDDEISAELNSESRHFHSQSESHPKDSQFSDSELEYRNWKRSLFVKYCESCAHVNSYSRACTLLNNAPRFTPHCVYEITERVESYFLEKYFNLRKKEVRLDVVEKNFQETEFLATSVRDNGAPVYLRTINTLVNWFEQLIRREMLRGYSRRICSNCNHYLGDDSCSMNPQMRVLGTSVVVARECRNCMFFADETCSVQLIPIKGDSNLCEHGKLRVSAKICDNCQYFRKQNSKCSRNIKTDITATSKMCSKSLHKSFAECSTFEYLSVQTDSIDDSEYKLPHYDNSRELNYLIRALHHYEMQVIRSNPSHSGMKSGKENEIARRKRDFLKELVRTGEVNDAKEIISKKYNVSVQTIANDIKAIRDETAGMLDRP